MTTLITGVGAVGSHVAAQLQQRGERLVLYDLNPNRRFLETIFDLSRTTLVVGDVNDLALLSSTITTERVDRIVHLAGLLTKGLRDRPYAGVTLNIQGTGSILEVARTTGVGRVVLASTRGVNQIATPQPAGKALDEDFSFRVLSDRPKTMYELSKLTGELLGLFYHDAYGVDFIALRLGGGFGPTPGPPSGLTGSVLRPLVFGPARGENVRIEDPSLTYSGRHEFIYFKDDAEALALACFVEQPKKRVYNIRMEQTYTYDEVVSIARRVFPDVRIDVQTTQAGSMSPGRPPRDDFADTTAARSELGWSPKYDLEEGIRDWSDWIRRTKHVG